MAYSLRLYSLESVCLYFLHLFIHEPTRLPKAYNNKIHSMCISLLFFGLGEHICVHISSNLFHSPALLLFLVLFQGTICTGHVFSISGSCLTGILMNRGLSFFALWYDIQKIWFSIFLFHMFHIRTYQNEKYTPWDSRIFLCNLTVLFCFQFCGNFPYFFLFVMEYIW